MSSEIYGLKNEATNLYATWKDYGNIIIQSDVYIQSIKDNYSHVRKSFF